jgi:Xaa-Pro aminopeptidase
MPIGYYPAQRGPFTRGYRALSGWLSRMASSADQLADAQALAGFQRAQALAYACVTHVATQLRVGMSEIEAAGLLDQYLVEHGAQRYLHRPFAWFGEHARFDGYAGYGDYHPSTRRLAEGETAILDVSPMLDGYIGDVGYACTIGENAALAQAMDFMRGLRARIPAMFASTMAPKDIWAEVDRQIASAGYDNVHAKYPFCVLGHRVYRVKAKPGRGIRIPGGHMGWFSVQANMAFLNHGIFNQLLTPEHMGTKLGLWAVEPHIGWQGGGAKFEEILVVEPNRAYWLSDDVPHVAQPKW